MECNKPQLTVAEATRTTNYEGGEAFEPADPLSVHPFRLGHLAVRVGPEGAAGSTFERKQAARDGRDPRPARTGGARRLHCLDRRRLGRLSAPVSGHRRAKPEERGSRERSSLVISKDATRLSATANRRSRASGGFQSSGFGNRFLRSLPVVLHCFRLGEDRGSVKRRFGRSTWRCVIPSTVVGTICRSPGLTTRLRAVVPATSHSNH
jgi:hypothetical protein